jgi:hypothetical protein
MNQIKQNTQHNPLLLNTMNIFYSLSFYSPIIICVSIVLFSMFTVTMNKALFFFGWVFGITFLRIIVFKAGDIADINIPDINKEIPEICSTGLSEIFIPKDVLYSTYLLTFTMMYFMVPMFMISVQNNVNIINYGVLAFFICYIGIDIFIKNKLLCIPGNFSKNVLGNIFSGMFLGGVIAGLIMYGTQLKVYLYINEINSNKEVCSMPSKQQFKCKVYKDGTLVGNM